MVTTESKDEFFMVVIGGQDCYRLGIKEKLKLEMKKSGVVVGELLNTGLHETETGLCLNWNMREKNCLQ